MARELGMSVSGLHRHFKAVTALSPLQFQKRLRLLEARRLMLGEDLDAASAAYRVGYHDASHFNREYKSHVARPPDARHAPAAGSGAGKRWPIRKTRTALQADERALHAS
jgi:AraC-like DNA-binding protein